MSKIGQSLIDNPVCHICDAILARTKTGNWVCLSYECHFRFPDINESDLVGKK